MKPLMPSKGIKQVFKVLLLMLYSLPVMAGNTGVPYSNKTLRIASARGSFKNSTIVPNNPPVAVDDYAGTNCNITVSTYNFARNDYDPDGDALSIDGFTINFRGPHIKAQSLPTAQGGTVNLYTDGLYDYIPPVNFMGMDQVQYTICDVNPNSMCATATIYISVGLGTFLPVNLSQFSGRRSGPDNLLQWTTEQENGLDHFDLENATDNSNFTRIGRITAKGNCGSPIIYSFVHRNTPSGVNYYRLRLVNNDGKLVFSPVVAIRGDGNGVDMQSVYPNPFRTTVSLAFTSQQAAKARCLVYDLNGRLCSSEAINVVKGLNLVTINSLQFLQPGTYRLELYGYDKIMSSTLYKVQ
jgi:hypothetical protein